MSLVRGATTVVSKKPEVKIFLIFQAEVINLSHMCLSYMYPSPAFQIYTTHAKGHETGTEAEFTQDASCDASQAVCAEINATFPAMKLPWDATHT